MNLHDVLKLYGLAFLPRRVVLARHADARWDLERLHRLGLMDEYQARQARDVFRCEQVVSFMGERGTRSRLLGVYRVCGSTTAVPPWPSKFPFADMEPGNFHYELERLPQFADLEERLIVDWGASTRSWWQYLDPEKPKAVIELRPKGYVREFPGFDEVLLRFDDLERIVREMDANRVWHTMLGGVAGVYLITDGVDGSQYVGSASGEEGIIGRWAEYVRTKHGGNARLRALLDESPGRYMQFTFSVLRTLPRTMTRKEVGSVEALYKKKLGSRAFGLNDN